MLVILRINMIFLKADHLKQRDFLITGVLFLYYLWYLKKAWNWILEGPYKLEFKLQKPIEGCARRTMMWVWYQKLHKSYIGMTIKAKTLLQASKWIKISCTDIRTPVINCKKILILLSFLLFIYVCYMLESS